MNYVCNKNNASNSNCCNDDIHNVNNNVVINNDDVINNNDGINNDVDNSNECYSISSRINYLCNNKKGNDWGNDWDNNCNSNIIDYEKIDDIIDESIITVTTKINEVDDKIENVVTKLNQVLDNIPSIVSDNTAVGNFSSLYNNVGTEIGPILQAFYNNDEEQLQELLKADNYNEIITKLKDSQINTDDDNIILTNKEEIIDKIVQEKFKIYLLESQNENTTQNSNDSTIQIKSSGNDAHDAVHEGTRGLFSDALMGAQSSRIKLGEAKTKIAELERQLEQLQNPPTGSIPLSATAELNTVAEIRPEIKEYISQYGYPENHIFNPDLLAEIIKGLYTS